MASCKFVLCSWNSCLTKCRAKYPLALIDELLDAYGDDMGVGYDIGCSLDTTIQNSTMLSEKAARQHLQMIVAAFHAYKHGRLCQLKYHPMYRLGVGLEDLEVMERVFSASNAVASCVRYASRFHWLQFIDLHFMQWDDDKYAELSTLALSFIPLTETDIVVCRPLPPEQLQTGPTDNCRIHS